MADDEPLLRVRELTVRFHTARGPVLAVDRVSFDVHRGHAVGVVGESGCGKSVTSHAVMGLLPRRRVEVAGEVWFGGQELLRSGGGDRMRRIRGDRMAMVFQDPLSSLNPYYPVGFQVAEAYRAHRKASRAHTRRVVLDALHRVGIPDPDQRARDYPHQFSGGMRQRVMIAMALCCRPELLIADEPTTALDVTVQAQILDLVAELRRETGMAVVLITHALGVVAGIADDLLVMYAGRVVERGPVREVIHTPRHPYTEALLGSVPRLDRPVPRRMPAIPGTVPQRPPDGCAFHPRCRYQPEVGQACLSRPPELHPGAGARAAACHREIGQP